jgi:GT2 family glycosyltransferase
MDPQIDAVIVSYNSRDTLLASVRPLLAMPGVSVTVVDNDSADDSLGVLDGLPVRTIASGRNGGFGFGCNLGAAAGDAPYVLFLNPDAHIDLDDLQRLADVLTAEPDVGIIGPRLLDGDGTLIPNLRSWQRAPSIWAQALFVHRVLPRARWANEINHSPADHEHVAYPEWVSGACMLARRSVLDRIGGFDDGFFLYSEDMDICVRVWAAGSRVRYEPGAVVRHEEGCSAPRTSLYAVLAESRARYPRQHGGPVTPRVALAGIAAEALTHAIVNVRRPANARGHVAALRATLRGSAPAGLTPARAGPDAA